MRNRYWAIGAGMLTMLAAGVAAQAEQQPFILAATSAPQVRQAPPQPQAPVPYADNALWRFLRDGEWYASFGTNKEWWSPTDIHVSQPSLGNDFTIHDVSGHDAMFGVGEAPQYSLRIGRFINAERTIAVELSFDHTKYYTNTQTALVTGTLKGVTTPASEQLGAPFFSEILHNGANHLMGDAVYRLPLLGQTNETSSVAVIGRAASA
jgi:hypothetical protein